MKKTLRILGLSLIAAISIIPPARAYYCGRCITYCDGDYQQYYYISPNECCSLGQACGAAAEWWPDMCLGGNAFVCDF